MIPLFLSCSFIYFNRGHFCSRVRDTGATLTSASTLEAAGSRRAARHAATFHVGWRRAGNCQQWIAADDRKRRTGASEAIRAAALNCDASVYVPRENPPHQQWGECIRSMPLYSWRLKPVQSCSCWSGSSSLNAAAGGKYALLPLCAPWAQRRGACVRARVLKTKQTKKPYRLFVFSLSH